MPIYTIKEDHFFAECMPFTIYREGAPLLAVVGDGEPLAEPTETDRARAAFIRDALAASEPTVGPRHGGEIAEQVRLATSLVGTHNTRGRQELRDIIAYLGRRASVQQDALESLALVAGEIVYGDGTDASHQRTIDHSVSALKAHGISREAWQRAVAGEARRSDPIRDNAGKMLAALHIAKEAILGAAARELEKPDRELGDYAGLMQAKEHVERAIAAAEGRSNG